MRRFLLLALMGACCAVPAFSQFSQGGGKAPAASTPTPSSDPSVDLVNLREQVARQNKLLSDQVAAQRAQVKKNQDLLKEAQKIQAANLKLSEEKKRLDAQNADLQKQSQVLLDATKSN